MHAGIETAEQLCAATREHLRAAWGSVEGERYWLQLRGFDLPERATTRGSIGHSHVLGPELRSFDGARAVLFKLLAKAAMRLRHEGFLAGGLAIRIRFLGLEKRFERDLRFRPDRRLLHLAAPCSANNCSRCIVQCRTDAGGHRDTRHFRSR